MAIIDACAHPVVARPADINAFLAAPYRREQLNAPGGGSYPVPIDEHVAGSHPANGSLPGSDPKLMDRDVLLGPNADYAVLLPLTRGLVADAAFGAAICSATNEWLAATWLSEYNSHERYKGSIRVSPRSPRHAVKEIKRWADHPHFVQVAVTLESHVAYGEQVYFEIWEAASDHGLPVAIHADRAGGTLRPPTPQGYPQYFIEEYSQQPLYAILQLFSLIAHGVFERLNSLVFVFADGGFDYAQTLMWRLDKEWRSSGSEVPWVAKSPRLYLPDHVRFLAHHGDGAEDPATFSDFIDRNGWADLLMYASNYPSWDYLSADSLTKRLQLPLRSRIMSENAARLYRLTAGRPAVPEPVGEEA